MAKTSRRSREIAFLGEILRVPFFIWALTGYLWQSVDVRYGIRLALFYSNTLVYEIARSNIRGGRVSIAKALDAQRIAAQAIAERLGSLIWIDFVGIILSGCLSGIVLGSLVYGAVRLFPLAGVSSAGAWAWFIALLWTSFVASAGVLAWTGTLDIVGIIELLLGIFLSIAISWIMAWAISKTWTISAFRSIGWVETELKKLYPPLTCFLILACSWIMGGAFGWLIYEILPFLTIDLPLGL